MQARTILVVEDEPMVLECTELALTMSGYNVIGVESAEMAMDLAVGMTETPDLLITDISMPGMPGPQLAAFLRSKFPSLPILFTSGFSEENSGVSNFTDASTSFVQKPYSPSKLVDMVKALIG